MVLLLVAVLAVIEILSLSSIRSSPTVDDVTPSGMIETSNVQYASGDKIFEKGTEVIWRGAGGSYLFHSDDYQTAWKLHLPEIQKMGLNTMRLAFAFPDSTPNPDYGTPSSDILDFAKLDWVVGFLSHYGIKVILDCHNRGDMYGDFGSEKLVNDWKRVAIHYRNDARIAAYELFNEPDFATWSPSVRSKVHVALFYKELTSTIRQIDSRHIVVWESQPYLPSLDEVKQYFLPNVVFTLHIWWTYSQTAFQYLTTEQLPYTALSNAIDMRKEYDVPFWLGEFGCSKWPYNASNPEWSLTEQILWKSEEQALGWNLWMGRVSENSPWTHYLQAFPLEVFNTNLVRIPWNPPQPTFEQHTVDSFKLSMQECYRIEIWANGNITLSPSIRIRLIVHNVLPNDTILVSYDSFINVTNQLTISNEEFTQTHTGDWNTFIYMLF